MTIDEAIYCLKSYLPDNEINMCQKCKYYGFANENESGFLVLTCQSHMAHLMAIKALEEQPEIIYCKDCKYYDGRPCGIVDYYNTENDFCSRAERRTDEVQNG